MRFTKHQYEEAIRRLQEGMTQLEPDGHCCACCGDSGHQAWECRFNPLRAMTVIEAFREGCEAFHDAIHKAEETSTTVHEMLHDLVIPYPYPEGCMLQAVLPEREPKPEGIL